ncbi:hypothetical protein CUMW_137360 [Citrus unshiu]|uniref:Uncharacterized protein n=1 Tax=Citrus unshiu TaxID=55188 RepID=A0A2H5PHM8_CITUN|nr:hypothetical protein CUMW_137360 [Citrus unshiu]
MEEKLYSTFDVPHHTIEFNEEIIASVNTVVELADQCSANEPCQRPAIGYLANVFSSLTKQRKPKQPTCFR